MNAPASGHSLILRGRFPGKDRAVAHAMAAAFGRDEAWGLQVVGASPITILTGLTASQAQAAASALVLVEEKGCRFQVHEGLDASCPTIHWPSAPRINGRLIEELTGSGFHAVSGHDIQVPCPHCGQTIQLGLTAIGAKLQTSSPIPSHTPVPMAGSPTPVPGAPKALPVVPGLPAIPVPRPAAPARPVPPAAPDLPAPVPFPSARPAAAPKPIPAHPPTPMRQPAPAAMGSEALEPAEATGFEELEPLEEIGSGHDPALSTPTAPAPPIQPKALPALPEVPVVEAPMPPRPKLAPPAARDPRMSGPMALEDFEAGLAKVQPSANPLAPVPAQGPVTGGSNGDSAGSLQRMAEEDPDALCSIFIGRNASPKVHALVAEIQGITTKEAQKLCQKPVVPIVKDIPIAEAEPIRLRFLEVGVNARVTAKR